MTHDTHSLLSRNLNRFLQRETNDPFMVTTSRHLIQRYAFASDFGVSLTMRA
jgi:hypothetical protein